MHPLEKWLDPPRPSSHLSRASLDRLVLGEMLTGEAEAWQAHLSSCEDCTARYEKLQEERQAFLEQPLPAWLQTLPATAPPSSSEGWLSAFVALCRRPRLWAPVASAAVVLFVGIWLLQGPGRFEMRRSPLPSWLVAPTDGNHFRRKGPGSPSLWFYVLRQGRRYRAHQAGLLRQGDLLRFSYQGAGYPYLTLVLVDRQGKISWLYPEKPGPSIGIASGGTLPESVQLDDAPGPEQLRAFFSTRPLSARQIRRLTAKTLPSGRLQHANNPTHKIHHLLLLLKKQPPRP